MCQNEKLLVKPGRNRVKVEQQKLMVFWVLMVVHSSLRTNYQVYGILRLPPRRQNKFYFLLSSIVPSFDTLLNQQRFTIYRNSMNMLHFPLLAFVKDDSQGRGVSREGRIDTTTPESRSVLLIGNSIINRESRTPYKKLTSKCQTRSQGWVPPV